MGYLTELNTLLGLPADFDTNKLATGETYSVTKPRERSFPLHIAMLLVTSEWNFLGYTVVHSVKNYDEKCDIEFEVLSLFSKEEQKLYRESFLKAAHATGEIQ